ncbi:sensor histidine kinase [Caballeronia sp. J97]|uniref:sensor histidine kinase n=1 Tax=Caballeronia sp. J97 TaxID=2805429 RepID=UPI002AB0321A|nr:sensor histidine kinase [Caballeronia sp. J97]
MRMSLRARLLLWLLVPLVLFVLVTSIASYHSACRIADMTEDAALLASARTIGEVVVWSDSGPTVTILPAALEIFESPHRDRVYYKVVLGRDRLIGGTPRLAMPPGNVSQPVHYDAVIDGAKVRAVAYSRFLYADGKVVPVTVVVAKTRNSRQAIRDQLWLPQLIRECLMLALVAALVPLGLAAELRPLMRLKNDVAGRTPLQIGPMRAEGLPRELRPIVDAIDQCIAQIRLHTQTQRDFVAGAAHQLSTPLTLLDTQIQCACLNCRGESACETALQGARRSMRKMKAMTRQLLMLAQAESAPEPLRKMTDMAEVVESVLEELVVAAQRRDIDLGAECETGAMVAGNPALLCALVSNLVDNAIRYTQPGGRVTVIVRRSREEILLQVIDNGPGLSADARAHVFERFYRASAAAEGTGLGLSIVREIALRHGGTVTLGAGYEPAGLSVSVRLPAWSGGDAR